MLIHEQVALHAAQTPSRTALWDIRGEMTYGELWTRSSGIARALAALGAGEGRAAAVYVPFLKEIVLGAVSAWRAGCVFLPFDDAYPQERLSYMLENSGAAAVLTLRELWERKPLKFPQEKVIFMDEVPPAPSFDLRVSLTEDSPAMLLYTSGTTGRPKGVLHTHALPAHLMDWMDPAEGAPVDENTRGGVTTGFTFVATQVFMFSPLAAGGSVFIAPEAARRDLGFLNQFIRENRITHLFLPSGLGAALAEDYDIRGVCVLVGGEKLRAFRPCVPGNALLLGYGCTETGAVMGKRVLGTEERLLIGKPFGQTEARIVDDALRTLPQGEVGELLVSSPFMSRGYFALAELSAEKWVELDHRVWYRTGDRARCTPEGNYDILGRIDNMIKLRGFRVETGEVEVQAANAAGRIGRSDVGQFAVVLRTVNGTDHLVAYYESDRELDLKAIRAEAARYLAEYMVPDIWVRMDALPRNANGKVMRSALPQPRRSREHTLYGALDSEVLARFVYALEDVLDVNVSISPDDRFTDLGGTSLTAMKYAAILREQGIRISSAQILQLNELRKIAEAAEVDYARLWSPEEYEKVREDFASRGEHILKVLPITPEQDEMLFRQILYPDRFNFKSTVFLQVDSPLSEKDLREALDIVSGENETLRSAIVFHDVATIQQVITDRKIPLEFIRMDSFGSQEMRELKKRLLYMPMDLQRSSLMRLIYLKTGTLSMLCILTHGIAFEGNRKSMYLARLMQVLEERYPLDESIRGWRELLEESLSSEKTEEPVRTEERPETGITRKAPPEMCVYSSNAGPKLVFVHTANTGSAAYYRLAARIGSQVSFSVIEPFNLYHMKEARYGIKAIAAHYIEILKRHQPEGPYLLGGWCYGGMVAHEMACQLEEAGEDVRYLFLMDAHATTDDRLRSFFRGMSTEVGREYFETSPLFADLRESGMLEDMIRNAAHSSEDMMNHVPSLFHGNVMYFKPEHIPSGISETSSRYWKKMMDYEAGNYEQYCCREKLKIIHTPLEHDLMMNDPSLDVIVPEMMKAIRESL